MNPVLVCTVKLGKCYSFRTVSVPTRYLTHYIVALLAEGVDRNSTNSESTICRVQSPSSRRAWIEITLEASYLIIERVALLAEGVDRN